MTGRYQRFARSGLPSVRTPKVTIQKGGTISFNWFAYEALHQPRLVRPSYDEQTRIIKIEAARVENAYTIPVRNEGKGKTHVFAGRTFTQHFGIDTSTARQYEATVEQGKLFVDLKQAPHLVSKRKQAAETVVVPIVPLSEEPPPEPEQLVAANESSALTGEQPPTASPAVPTLEGLLHALMQNVEW